jgi:hypothetical protein
MAAFLVDTVTHGIEHCRKTKKERWKLYKPFYLYLLGNKLDKKELSW